MFEISCYLIKSKLLLQKTFLNLNERLFSKRDDLKIYSSIVNFIWPWLPCETAITISSLVNAMLREKEAAFILKNIWLLLLWQVCKFPYKRSKTADHPGLTSDIQRISPYHQHKPLKAAVTIASATPYPSLILDS